MNPFSKYAFLNAVDWDDPFGDEEVGNRLSTETVTIPLEEYEHLLLRVETAERMYAESKNQVFWLEKFNANLNDDVRKLESTIDQLARRAK